MNPPNSPAAVPPPLPARGQSPATVRRLGWVLIVLGPCLSAGMLFIAFFIFSAMPGHDISGRGDQSRWTGSPEFTRTTFELLGAIFVFGLAALANGLYQVITSRRNPVLVIAMLLVVACVIYFGCNL